MKNVYIALENIRSLYNVGALFRTCSFFGIYNVILVGYSGKNVSTKGDPILHEKINKSALGSENDLYVTMLENSSELIDFAKGNNLSLTSIEQSPKSIFFKDWEPKGNSVLVFGNEVEGVSEEILKESTEIVEIERHGTHGSLNVTTTAGIILSKLIPS